MARAWSFLTVEDRDRQFVGNEGYEDVLGRTYTWDDTVGRRDDVAIGDLAVIRDSEFVLGIAWIGELSQAGSGNKVRYRCPHCEKTSFKERKSQRFEFKYKCSCGEEFNEPIVENRPNTRFFRADYSRTWQPLDVAVRVKDIEAAYLKRGAQHSIREMNLDTLREIIRSKQELGETWWTDEPEPGDSKEIKGGHRRAPVKVRVGQQHFRQEMLDRFNENCAICGELPGAMLEAAHLYRYADVEEHDIRGGLLLRRDLHALFDRKMLIIDPDAGWRVYLDPRLEIYPELWKFNNQSLAIPANRRPRDHYLRDHANLARRTWVDQ